MKNQKNKRKLVFILVILFLTIIVFMKKINLEGDEVTFTIIPEDESANIRGGCNYCDWYCNVACLYQYCAGGPHPGRDNKTKWPKKYGHDMFDAEPETGHVCYVKHCCEIYLYVCINCLYYHNLDGNVNCDSPGGKGE